MVFCFIGEFTLIHFRTFLLNGHNTNKSVCSESFFFFPHTRNSQHMAVQRVDRRLGFGTDVSVFGKLKQEGQELELILISMASSRPAWANETLLQTKQGDVITSLRENGNVMTSVFFWSLSFYLILFFLWMQRTLYFTASQGTVIYSLFFSYRLKEHIADKKKLPILIFPEGKGLLRSYNRQQQAVWRTF